MLTYSLQLSEDSYRWIPSSLSVIQRILWRLSYFPPESKPVKKAATALSVVLLTGSNTGSLTGSLTGYTSEKSVSLSSRNVLPYVPFLSVSKTKPFIGSGLAFAFLAIISSSTASWRYFCVIRCSGVNEQFEQFAILNSSTHLYTPTQIIYKTNHFPTPTTPFPKSYRKSPIPYRLPFPDPFTNPNACSGRIRNPPRAVTITTSCKAGPDAKWARRAWYSSDVSGVVPGRIRYGSGWGWGGGGEGEGRGDDVSDVTESGILQQKICEDYNYGVHAMVPVPSCRFRVIVQRSCTLLRESSKCNPSKYRAWRI